jgi:para-aminobenzoate synthetase
MTTLLIDNYDSYTYIIYQYLWEINGERPIVIKNNSFNIDELTNIPFDNIVISPGPGTPDNPEDVGLSMEVLERFPDTPILGVCLGLQCMGKHFGGIVKKAPQEMHGKYSELIIHGSPLFKGLPEVINVVRYHSLIVERESFPEYLRCTAETKDQGLVMALEHTTQPFYGVQFHPESIGTEYGKEIFRNFKNISDYWIRTKRLPVTTKKIIRTFTTLEMPWTDPESAFENLFQNQTYSFWLDSSKAGYNGRYSFMGLPEYIIEAHNKKICFINPSSQTINKPEVISTDLFGILKECLLNEEIESNGSAIPFKGGFIGYLGYESTMHLNIELNEYPMEYPESLQMWVEKFLTFDHQENKVYLCYAGTDIESGNKWFLDTRKKLNQKETKHKLRFLITKEANETPRLDLSLSQSRETYLDNISKIKNYLKSGDTYEVCLSNEFRIKTDINSFELYKVLRISNPAPYSAYIQLPGTAILSSSPECFITLDKTGNIRSEPIKGTRSKGKSEKENTEIRKSLAESEKDHSELLMIIDLIRNDLSMSCEKGTVNVSDFMKITEYATVLQLSSVIEGKLREGTTAVDVLKSAFPGGSITGAPKFRTMQIINSLEKRPRGVYTGSIGYLSIDHAADFNIAIRTIVNHESRNEISFGSGGAVIAESNPEEEYKEILVKGYALLRAVYLAKFGKFENYKVGPEDESADHEQKSDATTQQKYMVKKPDLENIFQ